jgi:hypothetical protein
MSHRTSRILVLGDYVDLGAVRDSSVRSGSDLDLWFVWRRRWAADGLCSMVLVEDLVEARRKWGT